MTILSDLYSISFMTIQEALSNFGLNEKEAKVYVALLELGQTTAYAIAGRGGLKRPTVYVVLDELRQKGLVLKIPHAKKQLFTAKSPEEFFRETEERINTSRHILPELLALTSGAKKPKTLYFEGIEGMKQVSQYGMDEMRGKEMLAFYAEATHATPELIEIFDKYNDRLRHNNTKVRAIAPSHPNLKRWRETDKEYDRVIKIVPCSTYSAQNSIEVGESFVRILAFKDMHGIIIENAAIAETMRQIFEMVWESR